MQETRKPLILRGTRRSRTAELSQETGWLGGETQQKWEGGVGGYAGKIKKLQAWVGSNNAANVRMGTLEEISDFLISFV